MAENFDNIEKFIASLSDEEIDSLSDVLSEDAIVKIREDTMDSKLKTAVKRVEGVVKKAPASKKEFTLYKIISGRPEIVDGGELKDPSFLFGSSTQPRNNPSDNQIQLAIKIPKGTKAIPLPKNVFVLDRNIELEVEPDEGDTRILDATVKGK